jgi:deazaflavin-dependent oxidoreductase (nitroreductase family)
LETSLKKENKLFRFVKNTAASRFNSNWLAGILHHLDRPFIYFSKGRASLSSILTGIPVVVVTTTGAKSGMPRRLPLFCIQDGENFILIASSFGRKNHPGWYYNLVANPTCQVMFEGEDMGYMAREAEGEEREKYWQQAVDTYVGYKNYADWAKHRRIPVMVLEAVNT